MVSVSLHTPHWSVFRARQLANGLTGVRLHLTFIRRFSTRPPYYRPVGPLRPPERSCAHATVHDMRESEVFDSTCGTRRRPCSAHGTFYYRSDWQTSCFVFRASVNGIGGTSACQRLPWTACRPEPLRHRQRQLPPAMGLRVRGGTAARVSPCSLHNVAIRPAP